MTRQQEIARRIAQLERKRAYDDERDIAQREIAGVIGTTPETYSRYRSGKLRVPDGVIDALAEWYGVSPAFIKYGVGASLPAVSLPTEGVLSAKDVAESEARAEAGTEVPGPTPLRAVANDRPPAAPRRRRPGAKRPPRKK
jgi:transcriptional regulator with XRE-family HTH domain